MPLTVFLPSKLDAKWNCSYFSFRQGKYELAARAGSILDELTELYPYAHQVQ